MKYFLSFLFVAAMLVSGFSQEQVIGRSMVLKTSGHPDSIPSLSAPAVNFGNAVVLDTVSGDMYTFNYATEAWQKMVSENSPEARPYKVYTALLTQTGTNAPVATVLENTLGGVPVWSRLDEGIYEMRLIGAFPEGKYQSLVPNSGYDTLANSGGGGVPYNWYRVDLDSIQLVSSSADSELLNSFIEIRVYP